MSIQKKLSKFVRSSEFIVFAILVLVMCAFSLMNPAFLTVRNMFDLLRTMIVTGIFACGVMMIIISAAVRGAGADLHGHRRALRPVQRLSGQHV